MRKIVMGTCSNRQASHVKNDPGSLELNTLCGITKRTWGGSGRVKVMQSGSTSPLKGAWAVDVIYSIGW